MFCSITTESVNTNFTNPCRKPCNLIICRSNLHICTIVTICRKPVCISDRRIVIRCFVFSCINAVPFFIVNWSNSYACSKFSLNIRKTTTRSTVFRTSLSIPKRTNPRTKPGIIPVRIIPYYSIICIPFNISCFRIQRFFKPAVSVCYVTVLKCYHVLSIVIANMVHNNIHNYADSF